MRIAYPYPAYWPYMRRGVERCIHDLTGYLAARGHHVDIITSKPGRGRVAYDGAVRVIYLRQAVHPVLNNYGPLLRLYAFGTQATWHLVRGHYDAAHLWSYSGIVTAPLLRRALDLPYLFHMVLRTHRWPGRVDRLVFEQLMRHADRVAALTPGGAREMEATYGVPAMALPPPVNTETFTPSAPKDLSAPRVLFTGDLGDPRKGGPLLLRAWNEIHRRCPRATLVLAGPFGLGFDRGSDVYTLERMEALVPGAAARAAIEVPGAGALRALPMEYSRAAVTVLPSVEEAFGMVVTESLACGTPVVCSSSAGPGEIMRSPDVGVTVPLETYGDLVSELRAQQLADAVIEAIEIARRPGTADRCRAWAMQFSLDRIGAVTEQLLIAMADGGDLRSVELQPWPA